MKVGDRVRIKSDEHCSKNFANYNSYRMSKFCNKVGTIIGKYYSNDSNAYPDGIAYEIDISSSEEVCNKYGIKFVWNSLCLEKHNTLMDTE